MSSHNVIADEDSNASNDEPSAVDESPELRPTVELRSQAKIDSEAIAKVDGTGEHPYGMTLVAEEKWAAREQEKARTRERRATQSTVREQGSRASVARGREQARREFDERAASVDPWLGPERGDPRAELEREELAAVNQQAARQAADLENWPSRAAVSRQLAERVAEGCSVLGASIGVTESVRASAGVVQPIASIDPWAYEATVEGVVQLLFEPASVAQQQVGILADDAGDRLKVTIWTKSQQGTVLREGDRVRIAGGKPDEYNGQVTLAVTHDTLVTVLERGEGPAPVHHTCKARVWAGGSDRRGEQRHGVSNEAVGRGEHVGRPAAGRFEGAETWVFPASACPDWWVEQESVGVVEQGK